MRQPKLALERAMAKAQPLLPQLVAAMEPFSSARTQRAVLNLRLAAPPSCSASVRRAFAGVLPLTPAWRAQVVAGRGGP